MAPWRPASTQLTISAIPVWASSRLDTVMKSAFKSNEIFQSFNTTSGDNFALKDLKHSLPHEPHNVFKESLITM
jgi:hypothetical protein